LILINEKTIKKNPNAGKHDALVPGPVTRTVHADGSYEETRTVEHIRFMKPEPKYFYEYEKVRCVKCSWEGNVDDLEADCCWEGSEDEMYSNEICPNCNEWNCLGEHKFETIEECFKRIGRERE